MFLKNKLMLLILTLAVTIGIFTAQPVFSQAGDHYFSGILTSIDKTNMTITVQSAENETKTFQPQTTTLIYLDEKTSSLNDLSTGIELLISYYIHPGNEIEIASISAKTAD